ncbi:ATP-dependent DNA helicase PIF1 [Metarhizium brunneum]
MLCLPNEILLLILEHLYHINENFRRFGNISDLLSCRVVCKKFANVGGHLAFSHIDFMHKEDGYRKLLAISYSSQTNNVRYLTCSFEEFDSERVSRDNFDTYIKRHAGEDSFKTICPRKLDEAYKEHCHGHLRNSFLEQTNLDVAVLAVVLPRLGNLRSIRITQSPKSLPSLGRCGMYYKDFRRLLQLSTGPRVFSSITTSLYATNVELTGLVLRSHDVAGLNLPLTGIVRTLSSTRSPIHEHALKALEFLSIDLTSYEKKEVSNYDGLLNLIQYAPRLEKLEISLGCGEDSLLPLNFLERVSIPKLRIIRFEGADFHDPSNLMNFYSKHSATLKRMELCDVALRRGSWERVFSHIRKTPVHSSGMDRDLCVSDKFNNVEISSEGVLYSDLDLSPHVMNNLIESPSDRLRAKLSSYLVHSRSS